MDVMQTWIVPLWQGDLCAAIGHCHAVASSPKTDIAPP